MKKVAFRNLGCKVNEYEMEYMQQRMVESGYEIVPFDTIADIYVVNTCTVTNIADRKSRQMLHKAKKNNKDAIVVAVGCYVNTDKEGAKQDESVDIVIGNNKKSLLPEIIAQYINDHNLQEDLIPDLSLSGEYEDMHISRTMEHTRAFIKIQDGCNQFCSYCAIPFARGRIRSREEDSILKEVRALAQNGYAEIVITGIHLSSYGIDFDNKANNTHNSYNDLAGENGYTNIRLLDILRKVAEVDGIKRIRLGSLEPRLITKEFASELSKIEKICPHFHLSLQSGCDETLKRMNRKYTSQEYERSVEILRTYFDLPAITTDVIVGFPGETEDEFAATVEFIKRIAFYELHVFKYSKRSGTVAASMKNQVRDSIKDERSELLIKLSDELSKNYREKILGHEVEVLFEEQINSKVNSESLLSFDTAGQNARNELAVTTKNVGHTREYIKVGILSRENLTNRCVKMVLDGETLFFE